MPQIIPSIDEVTRSLNQDLLIIHFKQSSVTKSSKRGRAISDGLDLAPKEKHPMWASVTLWLAENNYAYGVCCSMTDPRSMFVYKGYIYLYQKFDIKDARYKMLESFLQYPDETMRHKDVNFEVLMLEEAIAHEKQMAGLPPFVF